MKDKISLEELWYKSGDGNTFTYKRGYSYNCWEDMQVVKIEALKEIYDAAKFYRKEARRLRTIMVENNMAHYDSSGEYIEKTEAVTL